MLKSRDYSGISERLAREGDHVNADFYRNLARFLSVAETPNYLALIEFGGDDTALTDAFRMACVQDALQRV